MTQQQFADAIGANRVEICYYEKGERSPLDIDEFVKRVERVVREERKRFLSERQELDD